MRNLPAVRHDGPVSFFTAVLASDGSGWRARDVDLEEISDLEDLGEQLRAVALRDKPVIALIEREDQWFALFRADGQDEVRAFVSDAAASLRGHYAELDGFFGPDKVAGLEAQLRDLGKDVELHVYPGVDHAFFNDTRPEVYDADASDLAWTRTLEFLRAKLG